MPGFDAAELRVLRAAHPRPRPAAGGEALEADRKRRRVGGTGGPGSLLGRQVLVNFKAVEVGVPNFQRNPMAGNELEAIGMLRCFIDDEIKLFGVLDLHSSWMRHAHCGICSGLSGEG